LRKLTAFAIDRASQACLTGSSAAISARIASIGASYMMPYWRLGFLSSRQPNRAIQFFAVMGGRAKHRIGDSGLKESAELLVTADFSDAEVDG
jgi:hypothetical protein